MRADSRVSSVDHFICVAAGDGRNPQVTKARSNARNKLSILNNKRIIISSIVHAILVQRYYCAPGILVYINYSGKVERMIMEDVIVVVVVVTTSNNTTTRSIRYEASYKVAL